MAKDYGFPTEIEELRKKFNIRGDRLQNFLEKSGAQSEEEAIEAINGKYGTNVENTDEKTGEVQQADESDRTDGDTTESTESNDVPENDEVSEPEDSVEQHAAAKDTTDEIPEGNSAATGNTRAVSEKLYVHRVGKTEDPIVHPVSGKKL